MAKRKRPEPVLLFAGIIARENVLSNLDEILKIFGKIDARSPVLSFDDFSKYYEEEMGANLKRLWVTFSGLYIPEDLHVFKLISNMVEEHYSENDRRTINIDPGYISLSNVVLYTTKNYYHRIYIGDGIYAEVTLFYRRKEGFQPFPWTYPDYKTPEALSFFTEQREKLLRLRREAGL